MARKQYSAGMVKLPFWFSEFKKMISLLNSGMSLSEIKILNLKENIFSAPTEARAKQIFNTVSTRVKALDSSFYNLFEQCDIASQKLIALIAVMESDTLFFDFMYEVYREKLIIGIDEITDSDISVFFKDKQLQNERVAKWTDHTLKTLGKSYKTVLMESSILDRTSGAKKIMKPIMDQSLELNLKNCGMEMTLRALTGVR
ncbi:DUF1819 family protein [Dehalobacter sp. DCM]|uniref:DUF1819 family protein n=1 Tax=Dehalobacter sp. DCM TaxID=2907827 RepID=UPI0030820876|nr:DUF1819 family protein [Dehalobacter sp. DCM]